MAIFEGTLDEIYQYLGPRTSDIVSKLARPYRKKQGKRISCGELNDDNSVCKQYTGLHAAHIKGKQRKTLIKEILEKNGEYLSNQVFKIDLKVFEEEFERKHEIFFDVIKFMCPKHHKRYDLENNIDDLEDKPIIDEQEIEELVEVAENMENQDVSISELSNFLESFSLGRIKEQYSKKFGVDKSQICCSNVSKANSLWNFDVLKSKFEKDFVFVFLSDKQLKSAFIKSNTLDLSQFATKGEDKIRFLIDSNHRDSKGFDFSAFME